MPEPLTIKRPAVLSRSRQFAVGVLVGGPLLGLWYAWRHHLDIRFDQPWLNLGAHAALIAFPLSWAFLMTSQPMQFERTPEEFLGRSTFFDRLRMEWWTMFLMWPAPIFAVVDLGHAIVIKYLPHAADLSTTPARAAGVMAAAFLLGVFYATMLRGNSQPPTLVSPAGLRTGLIRFHQWEDIHHVSKHGDLYSIYHRVSPALPVTSFKLRNPESQTKFERYVAEHQIPVSNTADVFFTQIKISVVAGFILILYFCCWLRFNTSLSGLWIVLISYGIGIVLTLLLERIRGISKFGRYMPVIEEAPTEGGDDGDPIISA